MSSLSVSRPPPQRQRGPDDTVRHVDRVGVRRTLRHARSACFSIASGGANITISTWATKPSVLRGCITPKASRQLGRIQYGVPGFGMRPHATYAYATRATGDLRGSEPQGRCCLPLLGPVSGGLEHGDRFAAVVRLATVTAVHTRGSHRANRRRPECRVHTRACEDQLSRVVHGEGCS